MPLFSDLLRRFADLLQSFIFFAQSFEKFLNVCYAFVKNSVPMKKAATSVGQLIIGFVKFDKVSSYYGV